MRRREFHSRLKEFRLAGVVHKEKDGWIIPTGRPESYRGSNKVRIVPHYTHRGSRVGWVAFSGPGHIIMAMRDLIGSLPDKKTRQTRPISPTQLFEMLGKVARGELKE